MLNEANEYSFSEYTCNEEYSEYSKPCSIHGYLVESMVTIDHQLVATHITREPFEKDSVIINFWIADDTTCKETSLLIFCTTYAYSISKRRVSVHLRILLFHINEE